MARKMLYKKAQEALAGGKAVYTHLQEPLEKVRVFAIQFVKTLHVVKILTLAGEKHYIPSESLFEVE